MDYKILEHRADIKIKVFGKTPEGLYKNAVWAMAQILSAEAAKSEFKIQNLKFKIKVKSVDKEILLVDFLNDILGESQINSAVYPEARFIDFHPAPEQARRGAGPDGIKGFSYLKAEISGCKIDRFDEDIKAVTYHDLSVRQNKDGVWEAIILFDV